MRIYSPNITGSLTATGSNTLIGNTSLTGSLNITGSTTQTGNNTLIGNTSLSGSLIISGSQGAGTPTIQIFGDVNQTGYTRFLPITTNIDTSISASYIYVSGSTQDLYFSQNSKGYNNVTRLRWLEGNLYTGLLNGGLITTQSATVYQISSGSGIIVNLNASLNDNPYPTIQYLNWGNLSASIAPFTASFQQAFVGIDSTNNIFAQGTPFSNGQFDVIINIGNVLFQNQSTINGVKTQPSVAYGFEQAQNVFNRAFGPLKLSGYTLAPSGSSTGSLIVGSGTAYSPGSNYTVDPNEPYYTVDNGTNISKIFRYYQSGSTWVYLSNAGAGFGAIDPTRYSNNGALTLVPSPVGSNWTIQRVFWFPNSVTKAIVVYYGNAYYGSEAEAIANINIESFVEAPNTAANAIYLGAIVISGNGVFTNANDFKIVPGGLFRQVGGSGGGGSVITQTLSGLSDVLISGPTNGQPLVYNSTAAKWENSSTLTASLNGNASTATTASFALTASYVANASSFPFTGSAIITGSLSVIGPSVVTGSFTVITGSAVELQVTNTGVNIGNAIGDIHSITGSLRVSGSITGSLFGTASFALSSAGGLTNFIEGFSSATQATSFLSASNAAATVNISIDPKGSGSILGSVPDGTAVGGNARGIFAIDLQMSRGTAAQVASGNYSVIAGGASNLASGLNTTVAGGASNTATNNYNTVGGGQANTANGSNWATVAGGYGNGASANGNVVAGGYQNNCGGNGYSAIVGGESNSLGSQFYGFIGAGQSNSNQASYGVICGGRSNSVSAGSSDGTIGGGQSNTIFNSQWTVIGGGQSNSSNPGAGQSNQHNVIAGGLNNISNSNLQSYTKIPGGAYASATLYGQFAHASGRFTATGDAQAHELIWRNIITGTAQTELFLDGTSIAAILPGTNAIWNGIMDVVAVCTVVGNGTTVVGDVEATSYKVTIKRIGTTTSLVGGVQEIGITNADASMSTSVFTIDNNDTNESLRVRFTPPSTAGSTTVIRTLATFRGQQIQY